MQFLSTLNENPAKVNLQPSGITALLVAPTSSGKTTVTVQFATYGAARILRLAIGDSSSTITDRQLVYTSALKDHIIVSVKPKSPFVPLPEFTSRITSKLVERLIHTNKKLRTIDVSEIEAEVQKDLDRAFNKAMNTHAEYSLLEKDVVENAVNSLTTPVASFLKKYGIEIYNHAANGLDVNEATKNSKKLREAIKAKLLQFIHDNDDIQMILDQVYSQLNDSLDRYFHSYFDPEKKSGDGYFFKIIDLNVLPADREFIQAFFSNNNVHKGARLSIEVLCEEIIIHVPMNDNLVEMILANKMARSKNTLNRSVFEDFNREHVSITLLDTQGMFHAATDEELEADRLRQMLYNTRYDALIFLTPMSGNSNDAKFQTLLTHELSKYKKNVPVFFLCNKADEYADKLRKEDTTSSSDTLDDLFGISEPASQLSVLNRVLNKAEENTQPYIKALDERDQGKAIVLPVMFKDPVHQQDKEDLYRCGSDSVIKTMVDTIEESLLQAATFIQFKYHNDMGSSQRPFEVNQNKLVQYLLESWTKVETNNQVKKPALENIYHNLGRRPQGNGFNALVVRLKRGEGWDSNIRADYYINHDSFHIRFPANLANLVSPEFLAKLVYEAIDFHGKFEDSDLTKIFSPINHYFMWGKNRFVSDVLYQQTFAKAWSRYYSNTAVFNEFLKESEQLFLITPEQLSIYADHLPFDNQEPPAGTEVLHKIVTALQRQLEAALSFLFNMHVYKQ
ncbi:hypothetical protein M0651_18935 [Paenibacillus sp. MBLB2552]|uniref:Uncharacterized protein n=1 Tax=Paenibacillus mellifer TaxID=2937794 RepID=A0A9X1Y1K4_9BACL|nr:hypothetical protein [Paenibacillus mellifer]MCK8489252.1 hypothetical protein [Paenibacillus mellifer]